MACPRCVELEVWYVSDVKPSRLSEPFIVPALFEKYQNGTIKAVDEWTLSQAMRADTSPGGGISQLEKHYQEFIVTIATCFAHSHANNLVHSD